ncbi:hypothetical protein EHP00_1797 [Ecytonucleospora hepatopenaei]|uniref:Uncharacterized protein n=1 Tax=Ecytonucleospora hepatopenaei TaxID=646526 RepID=A0A1W0E491_9MICR|nr:hypothetical protein EHP00_1797 [Ecytonucleospora hepatopenaei]
MPCPKKNSIEIRYVAELKEIPKDFLLTKENKAFKETNLSIEDLAYYNKKKLNKKNLLVSDQKSYKIDKNQSIYNENDSLIKKPSTKSKNSLKQKLKQTMDKFSKKNKENFVEENSLEKLEKMVAAEFKVFEKNKTNKDISKEKTKIDNSVSKKENCGKESKNNIKHKIKKVFNMKKNNDSNEKASEDTEYLLKQDDLMCKQKEKQKTIKHKINSFFKSFVKKSSKLFKNKMK